MTWTRRRWLTFARSILASSAAAAILARPRVSHARVETQRPAKAPPPEPPPEKLTRWIGHY